MKEYENPFLEDDYDEPLLSSEYSNSDIEEFTLPELSDEEYTEPSSSQNQPNFTLPSNRNPVNNGFSNRDNGYTVVEEDEQEEDTAESEVTFTHDEDDSEYDPEVEEILAMVNSNRTEDIGDQNSETDDWGTLLEDDDVPIVNNIKTEDSKKTIGDWGFINDDDESNATKKEESVESDESKPYNLFSDSTYNFDKDDEDDDENYQPPEEEYIPEDGAFGSLVSKKKKENNSVSEIVESEEDYVDHEDDLEEESTEQPESKNEKKTKTSPLASIKAKLEGTSFKEKFSEFTAQVKSEIGVKDDDGKDKTKNKELAETTEDEDQENIDSGIDNNDDEGSNKKNSKKAKLKTPAFIKRPIDFIVNFYMKIVNFIFGIIEKTLTILAKIPVIGKVFTWLLKFTKIIRYIATSVPILLILFIFFWFNSFQPATSNSIKLPDNGGVSITNGVYDDKTNSVTVSLKNTGDIIATVKPNAEIYASKYYNPFTFNHPKALGKCQGSEVTIDIDKTLKAVLKCDSGPGSMSFNTTVTPTLTSKMQ